MAKFIIRNKETKGDATLYTRVRVNGVPSWVCCNIKVDAQSWIKDENKYLDKEEKETERLNRLRTQYEVAHKSLRVKLTEISTYLNSIRNTNLTKKEIQDGVDAIAKYESREQDRMNADIIEQQKQEEQQKQMEEEERKRNNVCVYAHDFYNSIKDGTIRLEKTNERYTENTIKLWHTFTIIVDEYTQHRILTWDMIDQREVSRFRTFLENRGFLKSTTNKYFYCMRALVGYAFKDKKHSNVNALAMFKVKSAKPKEKAKEIALSKEEVNALYDLPLTGSMAHARDLFLCGVFTAQRYSDFSRIKKSWFGYTERGTHCLSFTQTKTKRDMCIPILDERLTAICERYDYHLPQMCDVILNKQIKRVFEKLAESVPSLAKKEITLLTLRERQAEEKGALSFERDEDGNVVKPRWAMITTHTARRTGATTMFLSGSYSMEQMCYVTGHTTADMFLKYVKLSDTYMADAIDKQTKAKSLF